VVVVTEALAAAVVEGCVGVRGASVAAAAAAAAATVVVVEVVVVAARAVDRTAGK
jgi:hypothetical protein